MPQDDRGLSSAEAEDLLKEYGPNKLPEKPPPSSIKIFLDQLKSPLVYILVFAGFVTLLLGHFSDSLIIFFAVLVNTILGFVQERKAGLALEALKKLVNPTAEVLRDGKVVKLAVPQIVPGDVVILNTGTKIPADGKLLFANRFYANEAVLTGESVPVEKEAENEVFMGTIVAAGRGEMLVTKTASYTQIGKIAEAVQQESDNTPLKEQLVELSKQLSALVFILTVLVFVIGLIRGENFADIFATSVALAVSSIPEGLLVGLTVVLAIGMQRILAKKGLVRNLVSAETLGGVSVICVDKTGTLTKGTMRVTEFIKVKDSLAKQTVIANDIDDPIVISAFEWGKESLREDLSVNELLEKNKRIDTIPFSSKDRFFATLVEGKKLNTIYVSGAPEYVISWSNLTKLQKEELLLKIDELTNKGRRLIAYGQKNIKKSLKKISNKDVIRDLDLVGILAFTDPVRDGARKSLAKTSEAGIKTLVITGDYAKTARYVMKEIGIEVLEDEIMTGSELLKLTENELRKRLKSKNGLGIKLFARTTPDQKLKIVEALKANNEVVAMMGDGVNDAPALKKADIGIVVGEATDVAKETADLVLLDSSFETIVAAVEEGRGIFDNIRKILLYLMSDAFGAIVAVVGTIILGLPIAVSASQILWINLISDGFPDLALTVDPKASGIMKRGSRLKDEPVLANWMKMLIAIISTATGLMTLFFFVYYLDKTGDELLARSIAFLMLGINSLVFVFSVRMLTEPFWNANPFKNKWLNIAVIAGFILQLLPFSTNLTRSFFKLKLPSPEHVLLVFLGAVITFIMIEVSKAVVRKNLSWFQH